MTSTWLIRRTCNSLHIATDHPTCRVNSVQMKGMVNILQSSAAHVYLTTLHNSVYMDFVAFPFPRSVFRECPCSFIPIYFAQILISHDLPLQGVSHYLVLDPWGVVDWHDTVFGNFSVLDTYLAFELHVRSCSFSVQVSCNISGRVPSLARATDGIFSRKEGSRWANHHFGVWQQQWSIEGCARKVSEACCVSFVAVWGSLVELGCEECRMARS